MSRPTLHTKCVAASYAADNQRIAEFSRRDGRAGGLLSIRETESGGLDISVYRTDGPVRVSSSEIADIIAAFRAVLPYAESRLEDMEEEAERFTAGDIKVTDEGKAFGAANLEKARAAFEVARAALALADGGR